MPNLLNELLGLTYPTADEIMAEPLTKYRAGVIQCVLDWRREFIGRRRTQEALTALIERLAAVYEKPAPTVRFLSVFGNGVCDMAEGTIILDADHGSIVTALHELAHYLFGPSELDACRWSVHLFKRTFSKSFERCHFEGHLLIKNAEPTPEADGQ